MIKIDTFVTRDPAETMQKCIRTTQTPIDMQRMARQHQEYIAALSRVGLQHQSIPSDEGFPDCVFIEDTAIILDAEHILLTCPGAPSRTGETTAVRDYFTATKTIKRIQTPATLDGGDVLSIDKRIFVGLSQRTNTEGAKALAEIGREFDLEVSVLNVGRGLHLKSAMSIASEDILVYNPQMYSDTEAIQNISLEPVAVDEEHGANVLALGSRHVVVSSAAPRTADLLSKKGLEVIVLDVSEFHKADGALTCLSLRIPAPGSWCT